MTDQLGNHRERVRELEALIPALRELAAYVRREQLSDDYAGSYEAAIVSATRLLAEGFDQAALTALYPELERLHTAALTCAGRLRILGGY